MNDQTTPNTTAGSVNDTTIEGASPQSTDQAGNVGNDATTTGEAMSGLTDKERVAIAALSYEQARDQLIHVVQTLEAGGLNLDQSMRQWELGEALATRAQGLLDQVRSKLDAAQAQQQSTADTAGTQSNLD